MADLLVQKGFSVKRAAKDGQAALTLHVVPSSFVFETDDKGKIQATALNANKGNIYLYDGLKPIKPDTIQVKPYNCNASVNGNVLSFDSINPNQVCGKVEITATYKGQTRTAIAEFYVSKQKWFNQQLIEEQGKFESFVEEYLYDQKGIEKQFTAIRQTTDKITLEVKKGNINTTNLLKGSSLRFHELSLVEGTTHNISTHSTCTLKAQDGYSHNKFPYIDINASGYTADFTPGARFWTYLKKDKTYTFSMWYRFLNTSSSNIALSVVLSDRYNGNLKSWIYPRNKYIANKRNEWQQWIEQYDIKEDGWYMFAPVLIRNGHVLFSEVQLEEGNQATRWVDPDKEERLRRAGIDLDLERIILQANKVYTKNSKGETTSLVDEEGNFKASSLQTFDNGKEGHIIIKGNTEAYYKPGLQHPSRWIGYEAGEWVERMYDDNGNLIWEDGKFGKQFKMRPEQWEIIAERYISTHSDLKALFAAYTSNTLKQIFIDSRQTQKEVEKYTAARDVRGNIIASDTTDYTTAKQRDGKVFIRGLAFNGLNGLRSNNLSGLGGTIGEIGGTIGEIGGGLSPTLPTSNVTPFTGFIKASEAKKIVPQKPDTSHMTTQEEKIALDFFYKNLVPHWYTRLREEYSLQNVYNVRFRDGVPYYFVKVLQYQDGVLVNTFIMYANEEDVL